MRKPDGDATAGWYEIEGERNSERFWDGTSWTANTRKFAQESTSIPDESVAKTLKLGKLLFRSPITSDWALYLFLVLVGGAVVSATIQDLEKGLHFPISVHLSVLALTSIWVYILMLLVLIPRRILDKRKGLQGPQANTESKREPGKVAKKASYILVGVIATIVVFSLLSNSAKKSWGDEYFEVEQRISKVVQEWNVAATPAVEAVRGVSNGTVPPSESLRIMGETSSKFAVIHNSLQDECDKIPSYDISSQGEEGAIAKAYDALQVTCDLLPQESTELLLLMREQSSPNGTQERINYHSNQIEIIVEKRKQAVISSFDAIMPYATDAQKDNLNRLRKAIS